MAAIPIAMRPSRPLSLRQQLDRTLLRSAARRAVVPFLLSRVALVVCTLIAGGGVFDLSRWRFWDGAFYAFIAAHGYLSPGYAAWFPLWPALLHLTSGAFAFASPNPFVASFYAGLLIANAATFAACVALELLSPSRATAPLPISALFLASPFAFFLASSYTEPIFLLLAVLCLLALRRDALGWAVVASGLATATRPMGVALLAPILYVSLRRRGVTLRSIPGSILGSITGCVPLLAASASGLIVYCAYCLVRVGDPLAWLHAESSYHGHIVSLPWQTAGLIVVAGAAGPTVPLVADTLGLLASSALLGLSARRIPVEQALYGIGALLPVVLLPVAAGPDPLVSGGRYGLVVVPIFLLLHRATVRRPLLAWLLLSLSATCQAFLVLYELRGGWLV